MTARTRIWLVVAVAAAGAATVAGLVAAHAQRGERHASLPQGAPRLLLDLDEATGADARALRRAGALYDAGKRKEAGTIFGRYGTPQARVGAAFSSWPAGTLSRLEGLAASYPGDSFVLLHLGFARLWSGDSHGALTAWRRAERAQPDTLSALRAEDFLHPQWDFREGFSIQRLLPALTFAVPPALARLAPAQRLAALRGRTDTEGRVLYGLELAREGHRVSAERVLRAAASGAPGDADAATAAAVLLFDKDNPGRPFPVLGPLTKRFPHAAVVRFNLGLLLVWLRPPQIAQARKEFQQVVRLAPRSDLAKQARILLRAAG